MTFELWHLDAGSMIGSYESQDEALGIVRRAVERNGLGYLDGVALLRSDTDGRVQTVAEGEALAKLAGLSLIGAAAR
jgi:hypothetical protein